MDFTLTLNQYLGLPDKILKITAKNKSNVERLPLNVCNLYDTREITNSVEKEFARFRRIQYMYKFSPTDYIKITPNYSPREVMQSRSNDGQFEKLVQNKNDELIWAKMFYDSIINVSHKLTGQEAICLVESLFKIKSADDIAETLEVDPKTVYAIRKSYNIKIWYELELMKNIEE